MNIRHLFALGSAIGSFFLFNETALLADPCCYSPCCQEVVEQEATFGNAGFGVTNPSLWYTITTNSYPDSVPLSLNRNKGSTEGNVYLSPTGVTIGETGNYWITITAILQNSGSDSILIPVFLAQDEVFNTASPEIGGIAVLSPGAISTINGTGAIKNITAGTRLSLVATNGGAPLPQDVTVIGWGISLFKLP